MTLYHVPTADFVQKTLDAELLSGTTASATLNNTTNIQNKTGVMIVNRINSNNEETPSSVEVIGFSGTSGSTVITLTRALAGTTAKDHAVNSIVEFGPDIVWAQGLIDTLLVEHNEDGTHASTIVKTTGSQSLASKTLVAPIIDDALLINHESSVSTPASGKVALYVKSDDKVYKKNSSGTEAEVGSSILTTTQYAPQGFLINGKIVPSVSSNNLTVALKGLDGNDPSASNPVYCRIGDTVRTITSALSVTKNAGTNWCNAGSAELATKEIDYFVYLGYNATDGVVIGFSRIPFATSYGDFSATTTNEKYAAISTITTAASTDYYELVGRFAATLSAGAGYTWSVPTFTATNLLQRPIRETRWLSFAPTLTGGTGGSAVGPVYQVVGSNVTLQIKQIGNNSNATTKSFVGPFALVSGTAQFSAAIINITDNSLNLSTLGHLEMTDGSSTISAYKAFYETVWTASGACNLYIPNLTYRIN